MSAKTKTTSCRVCGDYHAPCATEQIEKLRAALTEVLDSQSGIFVAWARWSEDGNPGAAGALDRRREAHMKARALLGESE